jgi:polyhydroxyalkanoate synthesis regulator phasin
MLEDANVVYTLTRAPERRVFYVDVGNLPKAKAEQYLYDMMARHKNKVVYDPATGEVKDDRKMMTMTEDYWFPRREGNRTTEVDTLPSSGSLSDNESLMYFQTKLYKAMNVPVARLQPETMYTFGRTSEITREELKFSKFIQRVRTRFSILFISIKTSIKSSKIFCFCMSSKIWER